MMKKVLSIILTLGLILTTLAVPSIAEETGAAIPETVSTVKMKTPINPGASIEVQDFNQMGAAYKTEVRDETSLSNFSRDFGFTVTGNKSASEGLTFIRRHAGKSGNEGDYAVQLIAYGTASNTIAYMTLDSWKEKVTEGTIVLEYDWLFNPVKNDAEMIMQGLPTAYKYANIKLSNTKTIYDTDFTMAEGQWMSMRYETDVDNNKSSLWVNGTQYWNKKDVVNVSANDLSKLVFHPVFWSGVASDTKTLNSYFCLDNFRIYVLKDVSVSGKKYNVLGSDKAYTDSVPENAAELKLSLSESVDGLTAQEVLVSVNGGEYTQAEGFSYSDKTITLAMPDGTIAGDNISVKVNSSLFEDAIVENYTVGEEISAECKIVSPVDNATVFEQDGKITLFAKSSLATNVKFYVDKQLVKEFTQADESGEYSFEADTSALNYGKHEFKVVSSFSNGMEKEDTSEFVLAGSFEGSVNPGVSTSAIDFNNMSDTYATRTGDLNTLNDFGWSISGGKFRVKRVTGKSGAVDDYALAVYPTEIDRAVQLKLNGWEEKVTSGIISLEYDWKMQPFYDDGDKWKGATLTMYGLPVNNNHGGIKLEDSREIYNTGYVPERDVNDKDYYSSVWVNMRYEYDVANKTCSLWVNGTQYWNNAETFDIEMNDLSKLIIQPWFSSKSDFWVNNKIASFMLDNFKVSLANTTEVKKSTCTFGSAEMKINNTILAGAANLNLTLGGKFDNFAQEKLSLFVNGEKITSEAAGNGNVVSVKLPSELKVDDKVKVVLDKSLTMASHEIGKDIVVEYTVAPNNNKPEFSVSDCAVDENVFSCNVKVKNFSQVTDKLSVVIASYKDRTLTDLKVYENEIIPAGGVALYKTLNLTSPYDEIKVMVWKDMDLTTPWIGTTRYKPEK